VAIFLYLAGAVVELIAEGVLGDRFGERRRRRAIEQLRNHTIICGYGRVGRRVAEEFDARSGAHVILDVTPESVELARAEGRLVVHGDATRDEDLARAGLAAAGALVATSDSDESNLFITLSARAARPDLFIVARASNEAAARKLRLAGANRTVEPYSRAGLQIANLVLKPQVADFLDVVSAHGGPELRLEEIELDASCAAAGHTIRELRVRDATGAIIVAIRKVDGTLEVTPGPDATLASGDVVIGVGAHDEIARLESLLAPGRAPARGRRS
jgi:voltage-gated potassium channel